MMINELKLSEGWWQQIEKENQIRFANDDICRMGSLKLKSFYLPLFVAYHIPLNTCLYLYSFYSFLNLALVSDAVRQVPIIHCSWMKVENPNQYAITITASECICMEFGDLKHSHHISFGKSLLQVNSVSTVVILTLRNGEAWYARHTRTLETRKASAETKCRQHCPLTFDWLH